MPRHRLTSQCHGCVRCFLAPSDQLTLPDLSSDPSIRVGEVTDLWLQHGDLGQRLRSTEMRAYLAWPEARSQFDRLTSGVPFRSSLWWLRAMKAHRLCERRRPLRLRRARSVCSARPNLHMQRFLEPRITADLCHDGRYPVASSRPGLGGPGLRVAFLGSANPWGGPWTNGSPAGTDLLARSRSQGRTSAAWTGRWSLGYWPRSEYVLIEDQFVTTVGDVRIQSMRSPPVIGAW
jgi:hypothetical protein